MKIFRFLFGKTAIVLLLLIFQPAAIIVLPFFPSLIFIYLSLHLSAGAVGFFIVLILINRRINPDYVLPWAVFLLILPIAAVPIYLMFLQNGLSRLEKKRYRKIHEGSKKYISDNNAAAQTLKKADATAYGQSEYLLKEGKLPVYGDSQCKYYGEYDAFIIDMLKEIESAEKFIFLEYFIIKRGVLWSSVLAALKKKAAAGVEVRVMYDDIGSPLPFSYTKTLNKSGIKCLKFRKFIPVISALNNNRDHRKITVIDGATGFLGGGNLSDEYINIGSKFGHWKDSGVRLSGRAVDSLTIMFLQNYNGQKYADKDFFDYLPVNRQKFSGEGFVQPFGCGPMPIYRQKTAQTAIINLLYAAADYVYISTPYLIIDFQLTESIKAAAKRGVDVCIFTPKIPDKKLIHLMTRSAYSPLIEAGVKIFEYSKGFLHTKNILCDGKTAIVSTINFDYRSLVHHFECGVWMYGSPAIADVKKDFDDILSVSEQITAENSRLNIFERALKFVLLPFAPLM